HQGDDHRHEAHYEGVPEDPQIEGVREDIAVVLEGEVPAHRGTPDVLEKAVPDEYYLGEDEKADEEEQRRQDEELPANPRACPCLARPGREDLSPSFARRP